MSKKRAAALILLLVCVVTVAIFTKPVFRYMGRYLAKPDSTKTADIVVVEGGNIVSDIKMNRAIQLYRSGQAKQLYILLNALQGNVDVFGVGNYNHIIAASLDSLGIPEQDFIIHNMAIRGPYARNTALELLKGIKDKNITSVLIVNDKFHIRRSYLVYKKVLREIDVEVFTFTYDIYVDTDNWWQTTDGVRRVVGEYVKLIYYRIKGYF